MISNDDKKLIRYYDTKITEKNEILIVFAVGPNACLGHLEF